MKIFLSALFIIILNTVFFQKGIIESFDLKLYDIATKIVPKEAKESSVVIVDVDEKSLASIGQWPWSRVVLAKMLSNIAGGHPSSLGLDVIFPEKDKTSPINMQEFYKKYFHKNITMKGLPNQLLDNDKIFANAIKGLNTTMAVYLSNENIKPNICVIPQSKITIKDSSYIKYNSQNMLCNIEVLQKNSSSIGFINSQADSDGIFRRLPLFMKYKDNVIPSLAMSMLMNTTHVNLDKNTISGQVQNFKMSKNASVLLHFYDKSWYKTVSAVDVLWGNIGPEIFTDKYVLLGTSAVGLHDMHRVTSGDVLPGIDMHATLIDNILNHSLIEQPEHIKMWNFILSVFFSIVLLFYMYKKMYVKAVIIFLASTLIYTLISFSLLFEHVYISSGYFLVPFGIFFFIMNVVAVFMFYQEKKQFYKDLSKAHSSVIDSMAYVVESRDTETGAHIKRTKEYMVCLGEYLYENDIYKNLLTKEFRELVYRACPLHDIGKVAIPDHILKKPGKLTEDEFISMKEHSFLGKEILQHALDENKDNAFLHRALNIAHSHHEKWDGSGYPQGLKGAEIPLEARMMALSDVYDALISKRVYKEPIPFEKSEKIIIESSGTHFDPILVGAFIELKDKFREIAERIQ